MQGIFSFPSRHDESSLITPSELCVTFEGGFKLAICKDRGKKNCGRGGGGVNDDERSLLCCWHFFFLRVYISEEEVEGSFSGAKVRDEWDFFFIPRSVALFFAPPTVIYLWDLSFLWLLSLIILYFLPKEKEIWFIIYRTHILGSPWERIYIVKVSCVSDVETTLHLKLQNPPVDVLNPYAVHHEISCSFLFHISLWRS